MAVSGVRFDFSDVDAFFEKGYSELEETMHEIGVEAAEYNMQHGSYKDRTGNLRRSNYYDVDRTGLTIKNEADYASYVESKGYTVCSAGALYAQQRLREEIL